MMKILEEIKKTDEKIKEINEKITNLYEEIYPLDKKRRELIVRYLKESKILSTFEWYCDCATGNTKYISSKKKAYELPEDFIDLISCGEIMQSRKVLRQKEKY